MLKISKNWENTLPFLHPESKDNNISFTWTLKCSVGLQLLGQEHLLGLEQQRPCSGIQRQQEQPSPGNSVGMAKDEDKPSAQGGACLSGATAELETPYSITREAGWPQTEPNQAPVPQPIIAAHQSHAGEALTHSSKINYSQVQEAPQARCDPLPGHMSHLSCPTAPSSGFHPRAIQKCKWVCNPMGSGTKKEMKLFYNC